MLYKGIRHNILNDAPFIGALIIANDCHMPCKNCINEHLKDPKYTTSNTAGEIIAEVLSNGLNGGIILSGLEWTEQANDMVKLAMEALKNNLEVIIYSHHTEKYFFKIVPELKSKPIYVKFGLYDEKLKSSNNISYGVKLATSNQYIKYFG